MAFPNHKILDQLQKSWFNHGWFTRRSLEKDGFIALVATAYNGRIINKHAVALKALNPKDLKNNDIIWYQLFWS
jgi:hypothetical protein